MDRNQTSLTALLQYRWFEPVYYHSGNASFPTQSAERLGRWVGVADSQGDALTYLVLDDETQQVLTQSVLCTALRVDTQNQHVDMPTPVGEDGEPLAYESARILSVKDLLPPEVNPEEVMLPTFTPTELLGMTFLHNADDGHQYKAVVTKKINDLDSENHQNSKFVVKIANGAYEEILGYNKVCEAVEKYNKE